MLGFICGRDAKYCVLFEGRRKILRIYWSLIIKGGDAKYCVLFEGETQNVASLLFLDHQRGRRKILRLYGPFIVWDYIRGRRKILRLI